MFTPPTCTFQRPVDEPLDCYPRYSEERIVIGSIAPVHCDQLNDSFTTQGKYTGIANHD